MAATNNTKADSDAATLKEDLERLRRDFQSVRDHLRDMGERRFDEASTRGREQLDELEEMMRTLGRDARARGQEGRDTLERTIQERPLSSLLAAFGVGMLISLLLGGRRH